MKRAIRLTLGAVLVLTASACTTTAWNVTREALYPPKPVTCHIDWVKLSPTQAAMSTEWETVAIIMFGQHGDLNLTDGLRHKIEVEACKLGGDAVSFGATSTTQAIVGSTSTTDLMVLRRRAAPQAPPAPAPAGTAAPTRSL